MAEDLRLCQAFVDQHPDAAAHALERLPAGAVASLFDAMPPASSARAFERMTATFAAECLARMGREPAANAVAELRPDLAAALLRRLAGEARDELVAKLPEREAAALATLLRYPDGTAGALMDPRVVAVADDITAGEALAAVRRSPQHLLFYLYVVDRAGGLTGVIDIRELMEARPGAALAGIMHRGVVRLPAPMSRAAVLAHPGWNQFHALPVVDEDRLLGAIRYQTFRRLEAEAGNRASAADPVATVFALGELYWLALSGLIDGMTTVVKRSSSAPRQENHDTV